MNKLIIKSDFFIPEKRRKEIEKEIEKNLASDSKFLFLPNGLNFKILQGKAETEFKWPKRTDYTYQAAGVQEVKKYIYKLLDDATAEQLAAIAEDIAEQVNNGAPCEVCQFWFENSPGGGPNCLNKGCYYGVIDFINKFSKEEPNA